MMQYQARDGSNLQTFADHLASLSWPMGYTFQGSTAYAILDGEEEIGCFAIYEGGLLSLFHVRRQHQRLGQSLLADIRKRHNVKAALVPTCDEFFLSHVLDDYRELKIEAYFFADGGTESVASAATGQIHYRLARPDDIPRILTVSGNFIDTDGVSRQEVTVGLLGDELVAIGLVVPSRLWPRHASIGMFTAEAHRRKGIGARTIVHLKRLCQAQRITPVAGCGYHNLASKATLESAGMVTRTRLLRIGF